MTAALSQGMVTAVGLDAASACASIRARVDGFQETRFVLANGDWLVGAPVPFLLDVAGEERLAKFAAGAIIEALNGANVGNASVAVLLCLPEKQRVGRPIRSDAAFMRAVSAITELPAHPNSAVLPFGRPAGLVAVERARQLLKGRTADFVVIAGVDSYLTADAVDHHLKANRLLTRENSNGFIPGEAAASVVLGRSGGGVRLEGLGLSREGAYIYNPHDLPLRADGLTSAYAHAFREAAVQMADIGYRISDLIGEQYWFKQTALANIRLLRGRHDFQDLWSPAECLGNIGAAVVPVMLGMAQTAGRKRYDAGNPVLIEASGDDGSCGAAVFSYTGA